MGITFISLLTYLKLQIEFLFSSLFYLFIKGSRVAMPLSRIALQSPAGAARGQVWHKPSSWDGSMTNVSSFFVFFPLFACI